VPLELPPPQVLAKNKLSDFTLHSQVLGSLLVKYDQQIHGFSHYAPQHPKIMDQD
jgi:hypothetical protein